VLVRVNELAAAIEQALMAARIPVHVIGTIGFTARAVNRRNAGSPSRRLTTPGS
jgi:superfamily I DNA/RNA helicase